MAGQNPLLLGYEEVLGSPRESLNESSGSTAERRFIVPFNTRIAFAQLIVGTRYPNFPQSRVVSISLQPVTDDLVAKNIIPDPAFASADYGSQPWLATVQYGPDFTQKPWPTDMPKPFVRVGTELRFQIKGSAKFLQVPSSALKYEDDDTVPVTEDANSVILIPLRAIQLQWDFVNNPPLDAMESLLGKVNSIPFIGAPPETLLFESYDVAESFRAAPVDPHTHRVTLQFTRRAIQTGTDVVGWNHDYRTEPAGWERVLLSDDEPRYKLADFSGMFV